MLRVYVAGPISSGVEAENVARAVAAGNRLLHSGFVPFIPHLNVYWAHAHPEVTYDEWCAWDNEWLRLCNALLRLPGFSRGSDREVELARQLGIPVFYSHEELIDWFTTNKPSGEIELLKLRNEVRDLRERLSDAYDRLARRTR